MISRLYTAILRFYPRQFRAEFSTEMLAVFKEATAHQDRCQVTIQLLRELRDLPGNLFDVYVSIWFKGGNVSTQDEFISPSTKWQAFIGALPFWAFLVSSIITKFDHILIIRSLDVEMVVYCLSLVGLLIGWIHGFPLWSYSYLGWSLVLAWSNTNFSINGIHWGYQVWIPFGFIMSTAILWTRSHAPIKNLLRDIWNDWTRLMLIMYAMNAWVFMLFDENHNSYLLLYMLASTIAVSSGVWFFMRSSTLKSRICSIAGSYFAAAIVSGIGGLSIIGMIFWLIILFWPVIIDIIRQIIQKWQTA